MTDFYVALGAQVVGFIVWIVRIEMRVKFLQELHDNCIHARQSSESNTAAKLDMLVKSVAELQTDIKWLIAQRQNGGLKLNEKVS